MKSAFLLPILLVTTAYPAVTAAASPECEQAPLSSPQKVAFDVPAQNVGDALSAFADQHSLDLIFDADELKAEKSTAINGRHEPMEALALMLRDTGLTYRRGQSGVIIVERQPEGTGEGGRAKTDPDSKDLQE